MGLWSIITGAGKVDEVVDTGLNIINQGVKGIDAMFFTDEEKSQAKAAFTAKAMDHVLVMVKATQGETLARSITRRILAIALIGLFMTFTITGLVFVCMGDTDTVNNIIALAAAMWLPGVTLSVVAFYFGFYGVNKVMGKQP